MNIWNVKQRVTNKPLPMHFIGINPYDNKEIYKINIILNTIVQYEAPHAKREIPQCVRCQKFGHKNYCRNNPRCVKCATEHLTNYCPEKVRDDNVKCVNCNKKHRANCRGCMVHKQIQQKIYPRLRKRIRETRPIQLGVTCAHVHSSFTNRCTFIKSLITIYIKIGWLQHVSVYDHHQGTCN